MPVSFTDALTNAREGVHRFPDGHDWITESTPPLTDVRVRHTRSGQPADTSWCGTYTDTGAATVAQRLAAQLHGHVTHDGRAITVTVAE